MVGEAISASNAACGDRGGAERREVELLHLVAASRARCIGRSIHRRFVGQRAVRHVGHQHAALVERISRSPR